MMYAAFFILLCVICYLGVFAYQIERAHQEEREAWQIERKDLYDRIQAPSFAEYKQAEVKMVKAQKDEKPEPTFHLE